MGGLGSWLGAQGVVPSDTERPAATEVRPALRRSVAVHCLALAAGQESGAESRWLAYELSRSKDDPQVRLAALDQLLGLLSEADAESRSYVRYCRCSPLLGAGDVDGYLAQLRDCVATGLDQDRKSALRALIVWATAHGAAEEAWARLRQYEALAPNRVALGILRARALLAFGMHRAAAVELARIEGLEQSAAQRADVDACRLEERIVGEQYDEFLAAFDTLPLRHDPGLRHQRAFALGRTGQFAAAERELLELLQLGALVQDRRTLLQADLAMVRRAMGADLPAIAAALGPNAEGDLGTLGDRCLAARARLDLDRWRAGELARPRLVHLREALRNRLAEVLRQWRAMPEVSAGVAFLQWSVRRELLTCLVLAEWALDGPAAFAACLGHALATDACGSLARRRKSEPLGGDEFLRVALPPGGVLCWFLPAPHGSAVLVASAESRQLVELPGDVPLRGWLLRMRQAFRDDRQLGAAWQAGAAAATAPLEQWLFTGELAAVFARNRRVTILGRELLAGLPFEFLRSPTDPTTWLGHSHALDYLPSAALLQGRPAAPSPDPQQHALHVAAAVQIDPQTAARYGDLRLPITRSELANLAAPYRADSVQLDAEIDRSALRAACAGSACLVVFAHGRRRHAEEAAASELGQSQPVGIVLRDGHFDVEQLQESARMPSCVVLASCGAARAGVDRGEDGQLFTTAWLAAGCDGIVSAEGDLQVAATLRQVGHLLRELAAGTELAEALRRSRVASASEPGGEHPALHCSLRLDRASASATLPQLAAASLGGAGGTAPGGAPTRNLAPFAALAALAGLALAGGAAWRLRRQRTAASRRHRAQPPAPSGASSPP
ncbi:MAG: CHAT domain-containing protein [Planctomycetes bacterium]|nr:CHAT domain-containing protein [Planctomycetota bacterium]